jgi:hypothetical protein
VTTVAELEGPLLDYWVGRLAGLNQLKFDPSGTTFVDTTVSIGVRVPYSPSTAWSQGGTVIERLTISTVYEADSAADFPHGTWIAYIQPVNERMFFGATPLVAAMRAAVHYNFGENVDDL